MVRNKYFVTVDTEEISEVSLPDNGIEYEIYATPEEVKEIEVLFARKEKMQKMQLNSWGNHLMNGQSMKNGITMRRI